MVIACNRSGSGGSEYFSSVSKQGYDATNCTHPMQRGTVTFEFRFLRLARANL